MANANQELNKSIYEISGDQLVDIGSQIEIDIDTEESDIDEYEIDEGEIVKSESGEHNLVNIDVVTITRETLRCLECNYRGPNTFFIRKTSMLCAKCSTPGNRTKHKNKFAYECSICKKLGSGRTINGTISCFTCYSRFIRYNVSNQFSNVNCIESKDKCNNHLCNHCYTLRFVEITNKIYKQTANISWNQGVNDNYEWYLQEYYKKTQIVKLDHTELVKFDRSWDLILNSRNTKAKLESDLTSSNSSLQRCSLMITLANIYNIRSGITYKFEGADVLYGILYRLCSS